MYCAINIIRIIKYYRYQNVCGPHDEGMQAAYLTGLL